MQKIVRLRQGLQVKPPRAVVVDSQQMGKVYSTNFLEKQHINERKPLVVSRFIVRFIF